MQAIVIHSCKRYVIVRCNIEKPRLIQSTDSSLRGAQALKKKGLKGKWIGMRT